MKATHDKEHKVIYDPMPPDWWKPYFHWDPTTKGPNGEPPLMISVGPAIRCFIAPEYPKK